MCDLKKWASGVFPESWKVLAERRRRRRKRTKNRSTPVTRGDLIWWVLMPCLLCRQPFDSFVTFNKQLFIMVWCEVMNLYCHKLENVETISGRCDVSVLVWNSFIKFRRCLFESQDVSLAPKFNSRMPCDCMELRPPFVRHGLQNTRQNHP